MNHTTAENRRFVPRSPSMSPPPLSSSHAQDRPPNSKSDFETMVEFYLANKPYLYTPNKASELEVRFGTNTELARPLSKINYDNVVKQLLTAGFSTANPDGLNILRIQNNKSAGSRQGEIHIANIRAEIVGLDLIQEYCRTNNLQKLLDMPSTVSATADKIKFTQKTPPFVGGKHTGKPLLPVEFPEFNFRVSYQEEHDFTPRSEVAKQILAQWTDAKKVFRYINRVRFAHPTLPVFADISIVKSSPKIRSTTKKGKRIPVPHFTVQEANVFGNPEEYEIELEVDNQRVGPGTAFNTPATVVSAIRQCIRVVLSGLQGTNYPIAFSERDQVLQTYMRLIHGENYVPRDVSPSDFVGPSSMTLQLENIQPEEVAAETNIPNIRTNYTVTDKADGERKLLYVAPNYRVYMIDTNMNVVFTGTMTANQDLRDSLLDGEFITCDKLGKPIHLYAAFDVYYIKGASVRELGFVPMEEDDEPAKFRLPLLNQYVRDLNLVSVLDEPRGNSDPTSAKSKAKEIAKHPCHFTIKCKEFYSSSGQSIFAGCSTILSKVTDGTYEYTTDGLIFTPTSTGVGGNRIGHAGPLHKFTWEASFKWKPPQFNTIDFLVSIKKDKTGRDEIHHVFQEGTSLAGTQNVTQYKTLILRCSFNERKHGFINPMLDMINDQLPTPGNLDDERTNKPVAFQPTDPYDPLASHCNIELKNNGTGGLVLLTEEGEYFEEDTIVEFRYDPSKPAKWRWIPLRVRYDKTNELRSGQKNFGNAYHVANSNWHSIHKPVTAEMLSTGQDIPQITNEEVYYNRSSQDSRNTSSTKALRDFHNVFVKRKLILGVSNRGNTLIDYAVGKAGDLPKWIAAKLEFVFGIDVSKDNIENQLDGACARFLKSRKKYRQMPGALFVHGNSASNIRNGRAMFSEKDKQIAQAVFGQGPKDKAELGEGVYKRYGIGEAGFHVSSCQFAFHYFFESERTLHGFMRNLAECTRVGGYFIGTCYDGETVFQMLRSKKRGESVIITKSGNEDKMYEIIKEYDQTGFPEDELSLGYAVDVYQESINKMFREFLVNFKYVRRILEEYGFTLISSEEARAMGLPNGTGLFDELYASLLSDVERGHTADFGTAARMTPEEKRISFLNRYFVFRKMRNVNAEKIGKLMMRQHAEEVVDTDRPVEEVIRDAQEEDAALAKAGAVKTAKPAIRKLRIVKPKITIGETPTVDAKSAEEMPKEPSSSTANPNPLISAELDALVEPSIVFGKSVKLHRKK